MDRNKLENMIDTDGVRAVLEAIADICHEKADHVRQTWADEALAFTWDDAGDRIGRFCDARQIKAVRDAQCLPASRPRVCGGCGGTVWDPAQSNARDPQFYCSATCEQRDAAN